MSLIIRETTHDDIQGVVALQRACFPEPFPEDLLWTNVHISSHIDQFPAGQFLAEINNSIVASCTNMLVSAQVWQAHHDWQTTSGGLSLPNHDPQGEVMYGIDISVHPNFRGQGIARLLYTKRLQYCRDHNVQYGTVCRLPGFFQSSFDDPLQYAIAVGEERETDPTLTPLLKLGGIFQGIIPNYMEDQESGNAGAILKWQV